VETVRPKKAYWRGDYVKMASMLMSIDWNKELANKGVEDTSEFIKLKYDEVLIYVYHMWAVRKRKSLILSPKKH